MIGRRDFNKATISSALGTAVALATGLNRTPGQEMPIKSEDKIRKFFVPIDNERAWLFTFYDDEIKHSSDWTVNGIRASVSINGKRYYFKADNKTPRVTGGRKIWGFRASSAGEAIDDSIWLSSPHTHIVEMYSPPGFRIEIVER